MKLQEAQGCTKHISAQTLTVQWHMFIGFHIRDNITILCDDCATSLESAWLADALQIGDSNDSLTINGL